MFKQIKFGLSLVKYGFKLKSNIAMLVFFLIIGFIMEIASKGTNLIGGVYFMLIGLFAFQLIMSLTLSNFIQTSPAKKRLQITIPTETSTLIYLVIFTLLLIERVILIRIYPELQDEICCTLFSTIIFLLIAIAYSGICYKYFIVATVIFVASIFTLFPCFDFLYNNIIGNFDLNVRLLVIGIIGYVAIILGGFIEYGLGCLLYKKPLSEFAFKGIMKNMK